LPFDLTLLKLNRTARLYLSIIPGLPENVKLKIRRPHRFFSEKFRRRNKSDGGQCVRAVEQFRAKRGISVLLKKTISFLASRGRCVHFR